MAAYRRRTPNRRHIPFTQPRLAQAIRWLSQIPNGPTFVVPTQAWSQEDRDRFIVKNHLVQIFHPEHDLQIDRGILVRELPYFLKTGDDYRREKHLAAAARSSQDSRPQS